MQRDSEPPNNEPKPRHAVTARFAAVGLIAFGAFSLVTSAISLVHRTVPLLVIAAVLALVLASRAERKP